MIITIDTETQGLNCQAFIMGAICNENYKIETYREREKMWQRIMQLAERAKKKEE